MQDGSNGWDASRQELGFLTATAVAGVFLSGLVIGGWWTVNDGNGFAKTDVVDQGLHNLDSSECRATLGALLAHFRNDPRVLWVWVEESTTPGSAVTTATLETGRLKDSPRPYAFRPDAAVPDTACRFGWNSVHALSMGGAAGPFLEPVTEPWRVGVGP